MTTWNYNIDDAPKGEYVERVTTTKDGKEKAYREYDAPTIWTASRCGKVIKSRWIAPNRYTKTGRWDGYSEGESPVAWMEYYIPDYPLSQQVRKD